MLGYRERLAERFVPEELSYIAKSLSEQGRNVQIVERGWGGKQPNGSYFGGHTDILVEVFGAFPWQRSDLMERTTWGFILLPREFKYRPEDKALSDIVEQARDKFPETSFSHLDYSPNDKGFLRWFLRPRD